MSGVISGLVFTIGTMLVGQGTKLVEQGDWLTGGVLIVVGGLCYVVAYYLQLRGLKLKLKE